MPEFSVVSPKLMSKIEDTAFKAGLPVAALMEKAGIKMANFIKKYFPIVKYPSVGILIGPGHNGGDGLVVARELFLARYKVNIYVMEKKVKDLTQSHLNYFQSFCAKPFDDYQSLKECSFFVDALFGFGLNKPLERSYQNAIQWLNALKKPVVSIDIPSGLNSIYGSNFLGCVQATHTLCLGFYKEGILSDQASDSIGKLYLIDLGFPKNLINQVIHETLEPIIKALTKQSIKTFFNPTEFKIKKSSHKYSRGTALLFCGSAQYPGAALLAAQSALAAGCGYVDLYTNEKVKKLILKYCPEVVISDGTISQQKIKKLLSNKNLGILYGPGVSEQNKLIKLIEMIEISTNKRPTIVVDGSGLKEVRENWQRFRDYKGKKIITPHLGEFKSLFPHLFERLVTDKKTQITENSLNKFECVRLAAQESKCIVVLKGPKTVISDSLDTFVNIYSTPALAKAGTGDVLSGYIVGLIARGIPPLTAACIGVFFHSQAAIALEKKFGINEISPKKIINALCHPAA